MSPGVESRRTAPKRRQQLVPAARVAAAGIELMSNSIINCDVHSNVLVTRPVSGEPAKAPVRPIRVGFVLHAMQVAGAEMLVLETIKRHTGLIEPVIFCLDNVGALGEQLQAAG